MRRGIGLLNALMIMIMIAMILGSVAKISFVTVKHTTDSYLGERARLFMLSATENAILAIEGYDRKSNGNCLTNMSFTDEDSRFEANVTVLRYYCYDLADCACQDPTLMQKIKTDKSHGNVLLKIVVETNLSNNRNANKHIRLIRTTLQRL